MDLGVATYEIISKSRENTTECDVSVFSDSNFIYKVVEEIVYTSSGVKRQPKNNVYLWYYL